MRIQLDTTNDTVTILEDVDLLELVHFLNNTTPKRDWKIKGNTFRVPTEDLSWKEGELWKVYQQKDFTNPYVNPNYPPYTGDPILWCGEGTTQGVKIGEGGMGTTTKVGHDFDTDYIMNKYGSYEHTNNLTKIGKENYIVNKDETK